MMIIENAELLWLYVGKYGRLLGFDYQFNKKA